jgi:hypothetical protein
MWHPPGGEFLYVISQTEFYNPASIIWMQLQMGTEEINVD